MHSVYRLGCRVSLRAKFKETGIMTVTSQCIYSNILYAHKNIDNFIMKEDIHNIDLRTQSKLVVPRFCLTKDQELLVLSSEDGAEDKAEWHVLVKAGTALLLLLLYLYCVVFVCTLYQRSQKMNHINAMAREMQTRIANLHAFDRELYTKIQLLQDDETLATVTATAMSTEVETATTSTTY